ncbi:DNA mismatch repair protein MutL [compost metagenome]
MHPTLVDVNVHPAKLEVRFSKEPELNGFIEESLRAVLNKQVLIPQVVNQKIGRGANQSVLQEQFHFPPAVDNTASFSASNSNPSMAVSAQDHVPSRIPVRQEIPYSSPDSQAQQGNEQRDDRSNNRSSSSSNSSSASNSEAPSNNRANYVQEPASSYPSQKYMIDKRMEQDKIDPRTSEMLYSPPEEETRVPVFPELSLIGQHHGTYLIAQNEEGLYLIDQHAAHERVNYEYYYEKFGNPEDASQELLLPITLEFTSAESEKLKDRLSWFQKAGVILEHFGGGTFRVVSCPYWFPQGEESSIIEEMAEWVLNERAIDLAKLREKSSTLVSCKASIKANQKLTSEEATTLIRRLAACKQPYTCPHGRPIVVSFSSYDLEKLFKRVM